MNINLAIAERARAGEARLEPGSSIKGRELDQGRASHRAMAVGRPVDRQVVHHHEIDLAGDDLARRDGGLARRARDHVSARRT